MVKKIEVQLDVKDKGTATVKKFSNTTSSALKSLAGPLAAGAVIASFTSLIKRTTDYGDKLQKLNLQLGVSVENLDKLKRVGELAGVSFEQITTAIRMMARNLNDASEGTGLAKDALLELGLSADKLLRMKPEKAFVEIANALNKVENPTKKAALAMDIYGRSGASIIQMSRNLQGELDKTTTAWNQQAADQAAFINDTMTNLKTSLEDLAVRVLPMVVEAIHGLITVFDGWQKIWDAWIKDYNKQTGFVTANKDVVALTAKLKELNQEMSQGGVTVDEYGTISIRSHEDIQKEIDATIMKLHQLSVAGRKAKATEDTKKAAMTPKPTGGGGLVTQPSKDELERQKKLADEMQKIRDESRARIEEDYQFLVDLGQWASDQEVEQAQTAADEKKRIQEEMNQMLLDAHERERQANIAAMHERQEQLQQIAMSIKTNMIDPLIEAAVGTKDYATAFKEMAISVLKQLAQIAMMKAIAGFASSFAGLGGGGAAAIPYIPALADGGIVKGGFKAFAAGGMVSKPTLGLIGEGAMNEAVVPLPDGQSIPVDMKGSQAATNNNNFYIQAVDAASFTELARRNPEAIIRPLTEQIEKGNKGLRTNLKKAVS